MLPQQLLEENTLLDFILNLQNYIYISLSKAGAIQENLAALRHNQVVER